MTYEAVTYEAVQVTAREGTGEFISEYVDDDGETWIEARINGKIYTYLSEEVVMKTITKVRKPERSAVDPNFWAAQRSDDPHAIYYYYYA